MEKASSLPGKPNIGNLFSFFAKHKAGLMGSLDDENDDTIRNRFGCRAV